MSFIEFRDVYKKYKMGEISINAADGVNFEKFAGAGAIKQYVS